MFQLHPAGCSLLHKAQLDEAKLAINVSIAPCRVLAVARWKTLAVNRPQVGSFNCTLQGARCCTSVIFANVFNSCWFQLHPAGCSLLHRPDEFFDNCWRGRFQLHPAGCSLSHGRRASSTIQAASVSIAPCRVLAVAHCGDDLLEQQLHQFQLHPAGCSLSHLFMQGDHLKASVSFNCTLQGARCRTAPRVRTDA